VGGQGHTNSALAHERDIRAKGLEKPKASAELLRGRVCRYLVVGGATAFLFLAVSNTLTLLAGVEVFTSATVAFIACLLPAYIGHRRYTFMSKGNVKLETFKFAISNVLGLGITAATVVFLNESFSPHPAITFAVTSVLVPALNFLILNFFVFVRAGAFRL
jgi:putative flippase GtrA